ncbi:phage tail sheath protein FI [Chryseobacterium sp. SORGH_AS 447]|uniref:phage tail sheath family protein n=1 Tax=Chryseobacterium sp. SORGH_AS_0447 TaxID=3041769 RepID=UPI002789B039|nr:phage tail sheath C-terminal domain-containing protein [Chryseobacterium sp. SORGH_AS_0447]MDQ1162570.1 phage tail sheath protein FI [Chryseobacterium sp. SORGH_AS_0447]
MPQNFSTPGVYINEVNAFPDSVIPVNTAVPAFIGYTPKATYKGRSYTNIPVKITSFSDFLSIYGYPDPTESGNPRKPYCPEFFLIPQKATVNDADSLRIGDQSYLVLPDPNTIYYLYNSIRLFYDNGGEEAYIVSVGTYGTPSGKPADQETGLINPNIKLEDLLAGLALLQNEQEPTLYVCPDAVLLSDSANASFWKTALLQCSQMQTAIALIDVKGGRKPDAVSYSTSIQNFRNNIGITGLNYGAAYYPFIGTAIMPDNSIDYTNLFGGDIKPLEKILNLSENNAGAAKILADMLQPSGNLLTTSSYDQALRAASTEYTAMMKKVLAYANTLPPSGAVAGIITATDQNTGPWKAPANIVIQEAVSLPILLSDSQQGPLNIDPVSGKSINVIRYFNNFGIVVWGARTLDGNSQDWRYISVRRTIIFIEQSCKLAAQAYIFKPNNSNTWESVKSMINSFLTSVWKQGGLMGSSPNDAFSVDCGLGNTMTSDDVLHGIMIVTIKVAVARPAEFIVITFQQQMQAAD